jgi:hypothetical protein
MAMSSDDLPTDPEGWQSREVLEELYLDRDWTQQQIVDHFDQLTEDPITKYRIRKQLHSYDLRKGDRRDPKRGLAAKLLELSPDAVGGERA